MLWFKRKSNRQKQLEKRIELAKLKAEEAKAKAQLQRAQTAGTRSKWDKLHEDYAGMQEFAEKIVEDYSEGGLTELLKNPFIQQLIKAYTDKLSGGGVNVSSREKNVHELLSSLPPDVLKKGMEILKKKQKVM